MDEIALKAHLFRAYGGFSDKRIKKLEKSNVYAVDDRCDTDFGADGDFLSYFCPMWARVVGPDALEVQLTRNVPMSSAIREWIEAAGARFDAGDGYDASLVVRLRLGEEHRLDELAERIEAIVRRGAPRYSVRSYKYVCPRTAGSLRRLAKVLREFAGRSPAETSRD